MSNEHKSGGCFKYGCVGCLSVLALVVGLVFLVGAVNIVREPSEPSPVEKLLTQDLPEPPPLPSLEQIAEEDAIEVLPLPDSNQPPPMPDARVGRVVLDLEMGDFVIKPGPAGEPIRVEADFDEASFELREEFHASDDESWTYELSFGAKSGLSFLFGNTQNVHNKIELIIPRGHPLDIVGEIGLGETEVDLSGLWVRRVDLELGPGDHFIEFRDPLPFPMEGFRVDAAVGSVEVRGLGEASPEWVEVDQSIGELFLDLQGTWQRDATIDVDFGIGECRLWLPEDVHVDIDRASVLIGENAVDEPPQEPPADAPTLSLNVRSSIGEVDIEY